MSTPNREMEASPTSLMIFTRSPTVRTARARAEDDADGGEEEQEVEDAVPLGFLERVPGDGPDLHWFLTMLHEDVLERLGPGDEGFDAALLRPDELDDAAELVLLGDLEEDPAAADREALAEPGQLARLEARDRHLGEEDPLRDEVVEGALADDPAADDDGDAVADHLDVLEDVRGEEDGLALPLEPDDDVADLLPAERVEAAERLVQDDERRVVDERLGQPHPLEHAPRELPELEPGRLLQADELEERGDAGLFFRLPEEEEVRVEGEELAGRQVIVEIGVLGQEAQPFPGPRREVRLPEDLHGPGVRKDEPEDALDGRRLAGPVRPEVAEDFALFDLEADALEDLLLLGDEPRPERLVEVRRSSARLPSRPHSSPGIFRASASSFSWV